MKPRTFEASSSILAVFLLGAAAWPASSVGLPAQEARPHEAHRASVETESLPDLLKTSDVVLINQNGEPVRVYSDLVKGKIVVINTIFTTCTTVCPLMGANFAGMQKQLPAAVREQVQLISISVDPVTDTPLRLRAWAQRFGVQPGWTLLTGSVRDVETVLKELGIFAADKWEHSPVLVVGSEARGQWTRASGLTSAAKLVEIISGLAGSSGH